MKNFIGVSLIFLVTHAFAWDLFGTQTYEDCIFENMKNVTSDVAAATIRNACQNKKNPRHLNQYARTGI